jgi:AcrR family transcriptional regulator
MATKDNIMAAALTTFLDKGFAGASISRIAKLAQVNQSLIYHHFKSKEDLWCSVKKYCVDEALKDLQIIRHDTLEHFIQDLVAARLCVYEKASMRMLIHWQSLEPDTAQFYGEKLNPHPLFDIEFHVQELQAKNLIRMDTDYQVLSGIIFGLASYAFFDFADAFKLNKKQQEEYRNFVCAMLVREFKPLIKE